MKLGYTIIYVANVVETVKFYEAAFGIKRQFIHDSLLYAEMNTGQTTLAFAANEAAEMGGLAIQPNTLSSLAAGWEICFVIDNVQEAYDHAIAQGSQPVIKPTLKPWGQTVSYVRDINGCLVEIASPVTS